MADPILVGVIGNRLASILNEQQTALVNTAFSSVVRESLDLACGVFDSRGEMIGQSVGGTPGHINAMATGMRHFVAAFPPERLVPGDVLLTNDPWLTAGQVNDFTVATPVFRGDHLVAWFATCCHAPDIGGRILSAAATEVYEEGLQLPIMRLFHAGEVNEDLIAIVRKNVRTPNETVGDLYAQVAANDVGARSLLALMDEFGLDTIDPIADEIMERSETALRRALSQMPDGTHTARLETDGFGDETLLLQAAVTIAGDEIHIDFDGSSPQSRYGVNVVLNYTRAYASFAVKAAIAPEVPHNAGSFRPVRVTAPSGCVLNCEPPAPVASRHLVGHFLPSLLFTALQPALPGKLLAQSADALWMTVWRGHAGDRAEFMETVFQAGGSGARAIKDGLSTTGFPTGVRAAPTEVIETLTPLVQRRRELLPDSGGPGRWRGGLGQATDVVCRSGAEWTVNANVDRTRFPASGADGGAPGRPGSITLADGTDVPRKQLVRLTPDAQVHLRMPGGGGYGDPRTRDPNLVLRDVVDGYVSPEAAREAYGVAIRYTGPPDALVRTPEMYEIDPAETGRQRG